MISISLFLRSILLKYYRKWDINCGTAVSVLCLFLIGHGLVCGIFCSFSLSYYCTFCGHHKPIDGLLLTMPLDFFYAFESSVDFLRSPFLKKILHEYHLSVK